MARFDNGWVKFHRELNNHWIGADLITFGIFMRLLSWANIKPTKYPVGMEIKILERGKVMTSLGEIALSWGIHENTVRLHLKKLELDGTISQKSTGRGRIITICNYEDYQTNAETSMYPSVEGSMYPSVYPSVYGSSPTPCRAPCTLSEEVKKDKKGRREEGKKENAGARGAAPPSAADLLAQIWNEECGQLPKVQKMSSGRSKFARERLRENPDPEYWRQVVRRVSESAFCNGENERGWRADIDFMLRPDSHARAMEGKYDDLKAKSKTTAEIEEAESLRQYQEEKRAYDEERRSKFS